jgi:hypothetical protein
MSTTQQTNVVTFHGEHTAPTVYKYFPQWSSSLLGIVQIVCGVVTLILGILLFVAYAEYPTNIQVVIWVSCNF